MILSIDQSTSATKAVLFDERGEVVEKTSKPHRQIYPQPGYVEHDAEEIWQNVLAVAREIATKHDGIRGLSLTNQRETVVVFDRESGRPLRNAIVWQCRRSEAICRELLDAGHGEVVRRKTGLKIDAYFSASKLTWLMRSDRELAAKLYDGSAVVGTIDAYLIHRLTNGATFATDATNASRTLLFDIRRRWWDRELCGIFGVPLDALPQVMDSSARFGTTDLAGVLARPLEICGVLGDSQAALLGQRCLAPGSAKATFGTGTSVMVNTGDTPPTTDGGAVAAIAWTIGGQATYAVEGIINASGATLAWLKDQLGLIASTDEIDQLAASVPDSGGVVLVPAFNGLGAPHWNDRARAAIVGMTGFTTKSHVVRAATESIAFQIRDVIEQIERETGVRLTTLHADGGASRSAFLMQLVADLTQVELVVADVPEASALGAAMAGRVALKLAGSIEHLPADAGRVRRFSPKLSRPQSDRLHGVWTDAVRRVL